ncbi:hypothetical protein AGLY_003791, partial [Aphis glycines]
LRIMIVVIIINFIYLFVKLIIDYSLCQSIEIYYPCKFYFLRFYIQSILVKNKTKYKIDFYFSGLKYSLCINILLGCFENNPVSLAVGKYSVIRIHMLIAYSYSIHDILFETFHACIGLRGMLVLGRLVFIRSTLLHPVCSSDTDHCTNNTAEILPIRRAVVPKVQSPLPSTSLTGIIFNESCRSYPILVTRGHDVSMCSIEFGGILPFVASKYTPACLSNLNKLKQAWRMLLTKRDLHFQGPNIHKVTYGAIILSKKILGTPLPITQLMVSEVYTMYTKSILKKKSKINGRGSNNAIYQSSSIKSHV